MISTQRFILFIALFLATAACNQSGKVQPEQLSGNWFFIDEQLDSLFIYNEVYIRPEQMRLRLSKGPLLPSAQYELKKNTLWISFPDSAATPLWKIRKASADTLYVTYLNTPDQTTRNLELVRLNENEKGPLDYKQEDWKKDDNMRLAYEADFQKRYDEYTVKSGLTSWEDIAQERERADSANKVQIVHESE